MWSAKSNAIRLSYVAVLIAGAAVSAWYYSPSVSWGSALAKSLRGAIELSVPMALILAVMIGVGLAKPRRMWAAACGTVGAIAWVVVGFFATGLAVA